MKKRKRAEQRQTEGRQGRWTVAIVEGPRGAALVVGNRLTRARFVVPVERGCLDDLLSALQMAIDQREIDKVGNG